MLDGGHGPAAQLAMSILVRMANVYDAAELMDISQAHIDSTIYLGDATLEFAERLFQRRFRFGRLRTVGRMSALLRSLLHAVLYTLMRGSANAGRVLLHRRNRLVADRLRFGDGRDPAIFYA